MPHVNRRRPRPPSGAPYSTPEARPARSRAAEPANAAAPHGRTNEHFARGSAQDAVDSPPRDARARPTLPRLPTDRPSSSYTSYMRSTASADWHAGRTPAEYDDAHVQALGGQLGSDIRGVPMRSGHVSDPVAYALSFLLAQNQRRLSMLERQARAHGLDPDALPSMPHEFDIFNALSPEHAFEAGLGLLTGLGDPFLSAAAADLGSASPPPVRSMLSQRLTQALQDTDKWYAALAMEKTTHITQAQAAEHRCPISFVPFDEMTHPVSIASGHVMHVFEAEDLLTWMRSSVSLAPDKEHAVNPLDRSPLTLDMLRRVALKPTTEA